MPSVSSPSHKPQRLIYVAAPEPDCGKALYDEFLAGGFLVSLVPDTGAIVRLSSIRRPDLVVIPLCGDVSDIGQAIATIEALRGMHLAIQVYVLAPNNARAELVTEAIIAGAAYAFSPPYTSRAIVQSAENLLNGSSAIRREGRAAVAGSFGTLTHREQQVLKLIIEGLTNKEIGLHLGVSFRTVEAHRRSVQSKTGARNTAELVRMAIEG